MNRRLTIAIPCYDQTELLRRCLRSLREQTFKDFTVHIIDDQSPQDYSNIPNEFPDLAITYSRNEKNLGAIGNIFNSITAPVETPYLLSLHEDDTLHKDYLRIAIGILDAEPDTVFVGSPMKWFTSDDDLAQKRSAEKERLDGGHKTLDAKGFAMEMLRGVHFGLGSVVYRSSATRGTKPDLERYAVLCDRPYLIGLIGAKKCTIIGDFGMYVRDHGATDDRGSTIRPRHIMNLYAFYKTFVSSKEEQVIFYRHTTNNIIYSFHTLARTDGSFFSYLKTMHDARMIKYRYLRAQGVLGLIKGLTKKTS